EGVRQMGHEAAAGYERGKQLEGLPQIGDSAGLMPIGGENRFTEAIKGGLSPLVGMSAERQAEHAKRGESGEIIGEAVAPAAVTLAGAVLPKVLPRIGGAAGEALVDAGGRPKPLARLLLGNERSSALGELLGGKSTPPPPKPIGSAELSEVPKKLTPIVRAPEEVYQRPIEAAPGAGKGAAPA